MKLSASSFFGFVLLFAKSAKEVDSLENVVYGEPIFMESFNRGRATAWLTGSRGTGNTGVHTRNLFEDSQLASRASFRWKILSVPGTGIRSDEDERQGQCVRYGDVVYILNNSLDQRWLNGVRSGNGSVFTRNLQDELDAIKNYKWTVLSSLGTGGLGAAEDDLGYGKCVYDLSAVYLQNGAAENQWLSGDRSGVGNVITRNSLVELDVIKTYQWVLTKTLASPAGGGVAPAIQCAAFSSTGKWTEGPYTNGALSVSFFEGVDRESSSSFTHTSSWEATVTASVTTGFNVGFGSGEASLEVSASYGEEMARSVSQTVSIMTAEEKTFTFDDGERTGRVWQWQYDVRDICNSDPWSLKTNALVLTPNNVERPCCLPGFAADALVQHGPCLGDSPCLCSPSVCESFNVVEVTPTSMSPTPIKPPTPTMAPIPDASFPIETSGGWGNGGLSLVWSFAVVQLVSVFFW